MNETKSQIKTILQAHKPQIWSEEHLVPAAVLIPLFLKEDELHVLLTVRTDQVEAHKGQISFPGGTREPDDPDMLATALRETEEEVAVRAADVEILGQLDQLISVTDFIITPFVGMIPYPYEFHRSETEIAELLEVPLSFFLNSDNCRAEKRIYRGHEITVYFFDYQGHTIWGVTARILVGFLRLLEAAAGDFLTRFPFKPNSH
ncbi:MAG: CoA pyrophosphatase [bacterium]